jgi:malate dehydrogenase (oxaloacetate-decarboxylating)
MPPSLFIAAARALAKLADPNDPAKGLLPDISRLREVSATVAVDVVNTATAQGIARVQVADLIEAVHEAMWEPEYLPIEK